MLKAFTLGRKLRSALLSSGVTGEIGSHVATTNIESLQRLAKGDPYVTFGIAVVEQAAHGRRLTQTKLTEIMSAALGITPERFQQPGPGYIDPHLTAERLGQMVGLIDQTLAAGQPIVLATAHPGSLLAYYQRLAAYITARGGTLAGTPEPVQTEQYRWIDEVGGVHMLTDEGSLLHTHDAAGFAKFLAALPEPPGLVVADHGYAGAAINAGLSTAAIHDVDDPGIPVAAHLGADVLAIPMNDNQLNQPTATVIEAVLAGHSAP